MPLHHLDLSVGVSDLLSFMTVVKNPAACTGMGVWQRRLRSNLSLLPTGKYKDVIWFADFIHHQVLHDIKVKYIQLDIVSLPMQDLAPI